MKTIVVTGGSGFVGEALVHSLLDKGFFVRLITRQPAHHPFEGVTRVSAFSWEQLHEALEKSDGVIHLAGSPINVRWTKTAKKRLWDSRVPLTKKLVETLALVQNKPQCLISTSAIGLFENSPLPCHVESSPHGYGFLSDLCQAWEQEALAAEKLGIRVGIVRVSLVLGRGGVLEKLAPVYRAFFGGHLGSGDQPFPWIHLEDLVAIYLLMLENPALSGPFHAVAPHLVTMREFGKILGEVLHRPSWLHVPETLLRLAVGEFAHSLCHTPAVASERLEKVGVEFHHADLQHALYSIYGGKQ